MKEREEKPEGVRGVADRAVPFSEIEARQKQASGIALSADEGEYCEIPNEPIAKELNAPNSRLPLVTTDPISGEVQRDYNRLTLSAETVAALDRMDVSTLKVLDFCSMVAVEHGQFVTTCSVADYMEARGLKDRKSAHAQILKAVHTLSTVKVMKYDVAEWKRRHKGRLSKEQKELLDLLGSIKPFSLLAAESGIRHGKFLIVFNPLYVPILERSLPMMYHKVLLRINTQYNPFAYTLGRKILEHKTQKAFSHRRGKDGKIRLRDCPADMENNLKVATLLGWIKAPLYEAADCPEYMKLRYKEKVIDPLARDLNALSDIFTWEYTRNGRPLGLEYVPTSAEFSSLGVRFTFHNFPSMEARLAAQNAKAALFARRKKPVKAADEGKEAQA